MHTSKRTLHVIAAAVSLSALLSGCDEPTTTKPTAELVATGNKSASRATPAGSASPAAGSNAPFVRKRPDERNNVDACIYIGFLGFACIDALLQEKDPVKQRYMRRLSDADSRQAFTAYGKKDHGGVAHGELAFLCAESGPCGEKNSQGSIQDDGYACLTKAEAALQQGETKSSKQAHARACKCSPKRAQIPVMGGFLACDGNKPVRRATSLPLSEAEEIRKCGECDPKAGPKACTAEIKRLTTTDAALATYLRTIHVPRCRKP